MFGSGRDSGPCAGWSPHGRSGWGTGYDRPCLALSLQCLREPDPIRRARDRGAPARSTTTASAATLTIEEEDVLEERIEQVTCRWCGATGDAIETVLPRRPRRGVGVTTSGTAPPATMEKPHRPRARSETPVADGPARRRDHVAVPDLLLMPRDRGRRRGAEAARSRSTSRRRSASSTVSTGADSRRPRSAPTPARARARRRVRRACRRAGSSSGPRSRPCSQCGPRGGADPRLRCASRGDIALLASTLWAARPGGFAFGLGVAVALDTEFRDANGRPRQARP